MPTSQTFITC